MHRRVRSVLGCGALAALVTAQGLVLAPSAHAASLSTFSAPLDGTSATAQATRLPSPASAQRYVAHELGDYGTVYTVAGPLATGVLADRPAFVAKVSRQLPASDGVVATSIIQVKPGTDLAAEVTWASGHDGMTGSTPRTSTLPGGWMVWDYGVSADKDVHRQAVYAAKGTQIVRVYCQVQNDAAKPASTAPLCKDPVALARGIVQTKPALPSTSAVKALLPPRTPAGLTPQFANVSRSGPLWRSLFGADESLTTALGPQTVNVTWTVPGSPGLIVQATQTTLASLDPTPRFLSDLCPMGSATCTGRADLAVTPPGGLAVADAYHPKGEAGTWALETQIAARGRLLDIGCAAGDGNTRAMTDAESATCATALASVRAVMLPR